MYPYDDCYELFVLFIEILKIAIKLKELRIMQCFFYTYLLVT